MRTPTIARTLAGTSTAILAAALIAACSSRGAPESDDPQPRSDRNVITQDQMLEHRFADAYEAVSSLRAQWLSPRGENSLYTRSQIWVYLDNNRLGGVETLRQIQTNSVVYIRWFNPTEATARWGIDHTLGAILVSTHPYTDPAAKGNRDPQAQSNR